MEKYILAVENKNHCNNFIQITYTFVTGSFRAADYFFFIARLVSVVQFALGNGGKTVTRYGGTAPPKLVTLLKNLIRSEKWAESDTMTKHISAHINRVFLSVV